MAGRVEWLKHHESGSQGKGIMKTECHSLMCLLALRVVMMMMMMMMTKNVA